MEVLSWVLMDCAAEVSCTQAEEDYQDLRADSRFNGLRQEATKSRNDELEASGFKFNVH